MEEKIIIASKSAFFKNYLIVTNIRIFGRTLGGKQIDLPLDTIKSLGNEFFRGITVNTKCGRFHFKFIRNHREFPAIVSEFLISRRQNDI